MIEVLKMFDEDLKELARMIADRQGFTRPTEALEVQHEEISEGKKQEKQETQEVQQHQDEQKKEESCKQREQT